MGLFLFAACALAQFTYSVTDFRYILGYYKPPYDKQMQALLEGARMQPLPDGRSLVTDGKLHSFLQTGEPQMNVFAPEAFLNKDTRIVNSPGHMRVETADGKFSIEGDGFQWQTNFVLFISNRVHTVVLPGLFSDAKAKAKTKPKAKAPRQRAPGPVTSLDVISDHFHYTGDSSLGIYQGNVRVAGTNFWLTSGVLTLKVPDKDPRLETIRAQQNVILDYTNAEEHIHATGGQALYTVDTGQLRVTEHPAWQTALRQGSGDEVFIDNTNRIFRTTGHAWLKLATQGRNSGGLLPQLDLLATNAPPPTNQVVEIRSETYEFRTNFAVFDRHVHLTQHVGAQPKGSMDCGRLTVSFTGTNQVQRMVAEKDVVLRQDENAFTAGKAVYTPTNALLDLTENPAWRAGLSQGKGDRLLINLTNTELFVRGNASMRVPAGEVTPSILGHSTATNSKPQTAAAPRPSPHDPHAPSFADIYSEDYTVRRVSNRLVSRFRGGVYLTHTNMNLVCNIMTVDRPLDPTKGETTLVADQNVQFEMRDADGKLHQGKGDKMVYTQSVTGGKTNDIIVLTGTPALLQTTLQSTNTSIARNKSFTLDLGRRTMSASGQYVFTGTANFNTNQLNFKWPTRTKK